MDIEWIEASGEGNIHTYAVQHRAFGGWGEEVPYVTAYIDLKEGDRMMTVLRGVDPEKPADIAIGATGKHRAARSVRVSHRLTPTNYPIRPHESTTSSSAPGV